MDMNDAVARAISAERSIAKMTVKALAKDSGIPERSLMRVLQAEREIKVNQVAQLATALGVFPHEIIEHAEQILARHERGPASVIHLPRQTRPTSTLPRAVAPAAHDAPGQDDDVAAQQDEP
ncbi:MAG: helix-turn-helix domain-containing protein [Georgenia sp.]